MIHCQGRRSGVVFSSRECSYILTEMFVHYASLLIVVIGAAPAPLSGRRARFTRNVGYSTIRHNCNRGKRSSSTAVSPGSFSDTSAVLKDYVIIFPFAQNVRGPSTLFVLLIATAPPSQVFFLGRSVVPLLVIFDLPRVNSVVACDRSPAIGNPNDVTFFNR